MDTIASESQQPEPESPAHSLRRGRMVAIAVAAGAVLAAGATGVAMAADGGSSPSPSAGSSDGTEDGTVDRERRAMFGHGPGGHFGLLPFGGAALHGEFVVPDGDDGYQTMVVQQGEVTGVGSANLTVKSADGFSETYAVPEDALVNAARDGLSTIEKGADVTVVAVEDGGDPTAVRVADLSRFAELRERFGTRPEPDASTQGDVGSTLFQGRSV